MIALPLNGLTDVLEHLVSKQLLRDDKERKKEEIDCVWQILTYLI